MIPSLYIYIYNYMSIHRCTKKKRLMKRSRGYSQIRADVEIVGRLLGERGEGEEMLRRICQVGDIDPASAKIGCPLPLLKRWGYVSRIHLVQCVQMEDSGQVHESFGSKRHGTVLRSILRFDPWIEIILYLFHSSAGFVS